MNWHQRDITELYQVTDSSPHGLSSDAAKKKIQTCGLNELPAKKKRPAWMLFLEEFKDFMILILVSAAIVAGISGETTDMLVILSIVVLNALIGFIQQYKAGKAVDALKKLDVINTTVMRDGKACTLSSAGLVPGDIVLLEAGSVVPADIRLIESHSLRLEEAALTGESLPVDKYAGVCSAANTSLGDRFNMLYKNTIVINGRGSGIVVATGLNTEIGRVSTLLSTAEPPSPLQMRMADFSRKLTYILLLICIFLFVAGLIRGESPMKMLLLAISLAVAAIPEALPALITISLAIGAKKMVRKNILVRRLAAVETLGSVSVICTDKTGTITLNKMKVIKLIPGPDQALGRDPIPSLPVLMMLNHDLVSGSTAWKGDPMELALMEYAEQQTPGSAQEIMLRFPKVAEWPFDATRKCMTTIHGYNGKYLSVTKGAAEIIVSFLQPGAPKEIILSEISSLASAGMRVIAYGYRVLDSIPSCNVNEGIETNLVFAGLAAMMDPARTEVADAIKTCMGAGITTIMITGDHPETAIAIAKQTGIMLPGDLALSGAALGELSVQQLDHQVAKVKVYARVSPEQKLAIIQSLQRQDHYVAMTGDGVNDAPSLKMANIGIAMGISGTDISKEAAQMILLDDNFASIVNGIKEGRRIYANIKKFVKYILTCNSAEMAIIFLAPFAGLPVPLLPIQILWINLVTDGLPGLALSAEQADASIMERPPSKPGDSLFAGGVGLHIIWAGLLLTILILILQAFSIQQHNPHWQTMVFTALSISQLAHVFAIRSEEQFVFNKGIFSNGYLSFVLLATIILQIIVIYLPAANMLLKTQPLTLPELFLSIAVAVVFFHAVEFEKWLKMVRRKLKGARL